MNKKLSWVLAFVSIAVMACTTPLPHTPHTKEVKTLMQSAKTAADHEALAAHYEEDAKMLEEKAEEHKKILSDYRAKPYLYGKGYIGFDVHCERLIDLYTRSAEESLEMAKMHRQMAEGAE
jgi:hypothetical protein